MFYRLAEVIQNSEMIAQYEHDANSQLIENTRNGITTTYDYNELGQLETLTTTQLNENIMQFEYEYDKIGNIVSEVRAEGTAVNNRTYSYDAANQLTEFTDNNYVETYTYDNVGNMLEKDINGTATTYSYNDANQLIKEIEDNQAVSFEYNKNGDLTSKSTGETYTYDIQGNLTSIVGNGIDKRYTYNGSGNRLSETTDGETIFYVNDINRRYDEVLQTYNADGNVINTYTYGVDRIQSVSENTETYLYDGRGSVVGSVSDNVMTSYAYTAYGELMPDSATPKIFGYNAEATDFETGIQYLRARYYDTAVQRFVQEDDYRGRFTIPISMNRYAYTHNNPVMGIDPSGYFSVDDYSNNSLGINDDGKVSEIAKWEIELVDLQEGIALREGFIENHEIDKKRYGKLYRKHARDYFISMVGWASMCYPDYYAKAMRDYYKVLYDNAKDAIKIHKKRIKELNEEIKQLEIKIQNYKQDQMDERVENYPANDDSNFILEVYDVDVRDPHGVAKILMSNVGANLIKPYLRLLFAQDGSASIINYKEQSMTKGQAIFFMSPPHFL